MQKSIAAIAEGIADNHRHVIAQAAADGVITPEELTRIKRSAERTYRGAVETHRAQREGISRMRVGYVAPWISQELGPDRVEDLVTAE